MVRRNLLISVPVLVWGALAIFSPMLAFPAGPNDPGPFAAEVLREEAVLKANPEVENLWKSHIPLVQQGKYTEGVAQLDRAIAEYQKQGLDYFAMTGYRLIMKYLEKSGDAKAIPAKAREGLALGETILSEHKGERWLGGVYHEMAVLYESLDRASRMSDDEFSKAVKECRDGIRLFDAQGDFPTTQTWGYGMDNPTVKWDIYLRMGQLYQNRQNWSEARAQYQKVIDESSKWPDHRNSTLGARYKLAKVEKASGDAPAAKAMFEEILKQANPAGSLTTDVRNELSVLPEKSSK